MTFAVFLDRDGTVVRDRHFLADPDGLELMPGAAEGLRRMQRAGAQLVVVTNQSGVGRGYFTAEDCERVNERLRELLAAEGVQLAGIYVCPHAPENGCACRKPAPGLFHRAAAELQLELSGSFAIGDKLTDAQAGREAGAFPILLAGAVSSADAVTVPDLIAAADVIERRANDAG